MYLKSVVYAQLFHKKYLHCFSASSIIYFSADFYDHIEGVDLHSAMTGPMSRRRSSSRYRKYYSGRRVTPGERTVLHFGCSVNSTLVVSNVFWGVHQDSLSSATYFLPGDCTAGDASLKSDCGKHACTINTTAPVELPCQGSWRGSKVPQYIHINFFCMTGNDTNHIEKKDVIKSFHGSRNEGPGGIAPPPQIFCQPKNLRV